MACVACGGQLPGAVDLLNYGSRYCMYWVSHSILPIPDSLLNRLPISVSVSVSDGAPAPPRGLNREIQQFSYVCVHMHMYIGAYVHPSYLQWG